MGQISKIKRESHQELLKKQASLRAEERLLAFLNHSRLLVLIKEAGLKSSVPPPRS